MALTDAYTASRFCKSHFDRTGQKIAATRFLDGMGLCQECFDRPDYGAPKTKKTKTRNDGTADAAALEARKKAVDELVSETFDRIEDRIDAMIETGPSPSRPTASNVTEGLSGRENQVAALIAKGLANKEIGSTLGITERTVKFHAASVFSKCGVTNAKEMIAAGCDARAEMEADQAALLRERDRWRAEIEFARAQADLRHCERMLERAAQRVAAREKKLGALQ